MKNMFSRFKKDWRKIIPELLLGWFLCMNPPQVLYTIPIVSEILFGFGAIFWTLGLSRLSVKLSWLFTLGPLIIVWLKLPLTDRVLVIGPVFIIIAIAIIFRNKQEWRLVNWIYGYLQDWYYKVLWQFTSYRTHWYKKYEQQQNEERRRVYEEERLQNEERRRLYEEEKLQNEERKRERDQERAEREVAHSLSAYEHLGLSNTADLSEVKTAYKLLRGETKQLLQVASNEGDDAEIKRINERLSDINKAFNELKNKK